MGTKNYHGQEWRERTHKRAEVLNGRGRHRAADILYRRVIADVIAESEATR